MLFLVIYKSFLFLLYTPKEKTNFCKKTEMAINLLRIFIFAPFHIKTVNIFQNKEECQMDKNEAIIRYALQHRKLDDLKVWLLNGGSIKDYFASHKQNIKLNLNQGTFSVTAKDAEKIVEKMMPVAFSKQDLMHLYFRLSEEKQMEWYPKVFPYYPDAIKVKEKPSSEEILEAVKRNHYLTIPRSFYDILSDVDLAECLFVNDYLMLKMPKERWNPTLAVLFSQRLADNGAYYDRICVPEGCQNEMYWKNLCKADGFYYRILPEKYQYILSEDLVLHTLQHSKSFIGTYHLFEVIPERLKTTKVSLLCCLKHFAAIRYLPKKYQCDRFYEVLSDHGQNSFLNEIDLKTISKDMFIKCIQRMKGNFDGKIPLNYWDEDMAVIVAGHIHTLKLIPKKWQTKNVFKSFLLKNGEKIDQIPSNMIDEDLCLAAMESNSFAALKHIPDEMKTDSFWEKVIKRGLFYKVSDLPEKYQVEAWKPEKCRSLSDIPEEIRDEDHVFDYLKALKHIIPIDFKDFQTQKICDYIMEQAENLNAKLWILKEIKPKFRRKLDMREVLTKCKGAVFIPGLTPDELKENLAVFPENILFVPDWYEEIKIPEKYFEPGQQLTLSDLLNYGKCS